MNRTSTVAFASLATTLLLGAAGCKVSACPDQAAIDGGKQVSKDNCIQIEPTREYDGTPRTATLGWASGGAVSVTNSNGSLTITSDSTSATEVQISGIPFTRDGSSDADRANATAHIMQMAPPAVTPSGSGGSIVAPGAGFDGYKLTVRLPAAFDGVLTAKNGNGELTFSGTPVAAGSTIHTDNGDVSATIGAAANVTATAKTEFGSVSFQGTWMSPMVSTDMTQGTAVLGTGAGSIEGSTRNGDVLFSVQ
jgi:hypothetical protein